MNPLIPLWIIGGPFIGLLILSFSFKGPSSRLVVLFLTCASAASASAHTKLRKRGVRMDLARANNNTLIRFVT
jgi:hypothetical protein